MHRREIQTNIRLAIISAIENISKTITPRVAELPIVEIEIPRDLKHGDLTSNAAMRLAKNFSENPLKLAGLIKEALEANIKGTMLEGVIERIEVLPPGFVNFWLNKDYLYGLLHAIYDEKNSFGRDVMGKGAAVNIEFVSANPTGPLTVAHARQAAVGDALGHILAFSGYKVTREYFINDVGNQINLLGKSIRAKYLEKLGEDSEFPEDGYMGDYIKEIAANLEKKVGRKLAAPEDKNLEKISNFGVEEILGSIKTDLESFGVKFDNWFSQKTLPKDKVENVLSALEKKGFVYEKDGARWFKSTAFGDDKDRVVVKSDGAFTYLAPDIAYHQNKFKRHYKRVIDIWGPDHHGYISRIKAAVDALGFSSKDLSVLIVQLATLSRGGAAFSMSTRKGEFITLKEVIDEVGADVARFNFLMRKLDSHLNFDLELAKKNSMDNPVYYIQYAHARISSIFSFSDSVKNELKHVKDDLSLLGTPEEILILRTMSQFPFAVASSAKTLEPYRLVEYLNELAKVFHSFYTRHRVVTESDLPLTKARLSLVGAIKIVLATGLKLLGVSLPERM